jgi:WD40 repeat protein/serine/threonine protein kinase
MSTHSSEHYMLLNRLADEFAERYRRGERPSLQGYVDQYPQLADDIREYFPALAEVEQVKENRRVAEDPPRQAGLPPRERLGDFHILREIGRGGMGVVYEAEQVSLGRRVALKVLPHQLRQDARTKSRFEREARAAAKLHHTNIVPVFGVGEENGVRYYAMQFIQGLGLDEVLEELKRLQPGPGCSIGPAGIAHCELRPLADISTTDLALSLLSGRFASAAGREANQRAGESTTPADQAKGAAAEEGLQAQTPGRDRSSGTISLASSSLISRGEANQRQSGRNRPTYWQSVARIGAQVAEALDHAHKQGVLHRDVKPSNLLLDNGGTVWVTDFGLAKVEDLPNLTHTGDILGTLRYMPPEAFDGRADQRGDVYSLGMTLYELLAMRPAFEEKERNQLIKRVTTGEPPRLDKLNREIPRDLVTIVHKATDRDAARRYPTAGALADDLRRFLADEPIQARRMSPKELLWRWCRRNPVIAGLATALVLVFLIGFAGVAWMWRDAEGQKSLARTAERKESEQRTIAVQKANVARVEVDRSRRLLYDTEMGLAQQAWDAGDTGRTLALLEKQQPQRGQDDLRGFEWRHLKSLCRDGSRRSWRGHTSWITEAAFSPDGKTLATSGWDKSLSLWDVASLRHVKLTGLNVRSMAFSPDGKTLAIAPSAGRSIRLWDVSARSERAGIAQPSEVFGVAYSPDGKLLATAGGDSMVRLWDVATKREMSILRGHTATVFRVAFSPDGRTLASGGADNTVRLWDVTARCAMATLEGHTAPVSSLVFCPDGRLVASASDDTSVRLWDGIERQAVKTLCAQRTALCSVPCVDTHTTLAFSPDGKMMATGGGDGTIRLWDVATKQVSALLRGHEFAVMALAFAPDGRSLVSGAQDGTLKLWDVASRPDPDTLTGHKASLSSIAISPDGKTLAVADTRDRTIKLWDTASRRQEAVLKGHTGPVWWVTFAPDGRTLASTSDDNTVRLWDVASQEKVHEFQQEGSQSMADFSPDGKLLAVAGYGGGTVRIWDLASKKEVAQLTPGYRARFSPDGRVLAAGAGGHVRLWDVSTWQPVSTLRSRTDEILCLAFAPDSRTLAVGEAEGTLRLWDVDRKQEIGSSKTHASHIESVTFSPDGRRLASSGTDSMVKLWDVALLQEVVGLTGHEGPVNSLAFSSDGNILASASADATVRLWHAPPLDVGVGEPAQDSIAPPVQTVPLVELVVFGDAKAAMTPDGGADRIDVTAVDGTAWHVQLPLKLDDLEEGASYRVQFRAKATSMSSIDVGAQVGSANWHSIGPIQKLPLSNLWRDYEYEFQAKGIADVNEFVFSVGEHVGTVWIDDFSLTKVEK